MGAPADFVILRHLLTHPNDTPAEIARDCMLHDSTVRAALKRLDDIRPHESLILERLRNHPRKIKHRSLHFKVPNPEQFLSALETPHWLSGEFAAASEGYDLVPEHLIIYVGSEDLGEPILKPMRQCMGKLAPSSKANVTIRALDAWMHLDEGDLVERGQRLLDYLDSRHIQLLRALNA